MISLDWFGRLEESFSYKEVQFKKVSPPVNPSCPPAEKAGLSIRAGSRPKQPATDQPLAGYFRLILLLILVRNLK